MILLSVTGGPKDRQMDRRTNGRTDTPAYRDAMDAFKNAEKFLKIIALLSIPLIIVRSFDL